MSDKSALFLTTGSVSVKSALFLTTGSVSVKSALFLTTGSVSVKSALLLTTDSICKVYLVSICYYLFLCLWYLINIILFIFHSVSLATFASKGKMLNLYERMHNIHFSPRRQDVNRTWCLHEQLLSIGSYFMMQWYFGFLSIIEFDYGAWLSFLSFSFKLSSVKPIKYVEILWNLIINWKVPEILLLKFNPN